MSAGAYLVIRCDHRPPGGEQCDRERGWPVYVHNHTELRRNLKTQGWRRTRKGEDFCPDHADCPAADQEPEQTPAPTAAQDGHRPSLP